MNITDTSEAGKVYTFWSPKAGSGASFLARETAKQGAALGKRVILVDWDFRTPSLTAQLSGRDTIHCLDNILPAAVSQNLTQELLSSYTLQKPEGYYFLAGLSNTDSAFDIGSQGTETILSMLREVFDAVIIDCNCYIDNAGTLTALVRADRVFLVTEKSFDAFRCYDFSRKITENASLIDSAKFTAVFNKVTPELLLSVKEASAYLRIQNTAEIPDLGPDFTNDCNLSRGQEFIEKSPKAEEFRKAVSEFAGNIFGAEETEQKPKKRGFFGFGKE